MTRLGLLHREIKQIAVSGGREIIRGAKPYTTNKNKIK